MQKLPLCHDKLNGHTQIRRLHKKIEPRYTSRLNLFRLFPFILDPGGNPASDVPFCFVFLQHRFYLLIQGFIKLL